LSDNKARAGDEAFLEETLDEGLGRALGAVERALGAVEAPAGAAARLRQDALGLVGEHRARFEAYARGVRESGLAAFFKHELPRLRPQASVLRGGLLRTLPDVEKELFAPLGRSFAALADQRRAELGQQAARAALLRLSFSVTSRAPFEEFRRALQTAVGNAEADDENAVS